MGRESLFSGGQRPVLVDLFCGAGGAAMGYHRAGFHVIGIDLAPQPRYPFEFNQDNALEWLSAWLASRPGYAFRRPFVAFHASPPCQAYSDLAKLEPKAAAYPKLVEPVRDLLETTGLPYVIENVEGAPLRDPTVLCGVRFPELAVIRHRLFETNWPLAAPLHTPHPRCYTRDKRKAHYGKLDEADSFVSVNGGGNCTVARAREAMGIDWPMTKDEVNEAIPPAYTEWVGKQLLAHIKSLAVAA